jgi:hypothetical protein
MKNSNLITAAVLVIALVATAILISCGDDTKGCLTCSRTPSYFPSEQGDWWAYERINRTTGAVDTVQVRAAWQDTINDGRQAQVWLTIYDPFHTDTSFVRIGQEQVTPEARASGDYQDTVWVYTDRAGTISAVYLVPYRVGDFWPGINSIDTFRVRDEITVRTKGGSFDAYVVIDGWSRFEWAYFAVRYLVPNVGLVRLDTGYLEGPSTAQWSWNLIAWSPDGVRPQPL